MVDSEKVIKDLEHAIEILSKVDEPTFWLDFVRVAVENALKLLKAQETRQLGEVVPCFVMAHETKWNAKNEVTQVRIVEILNGEV